MLEGGTTGEYAQCGFVMREPGPGVAQIGYARNGRAIAWGTPFGTGPSGRFRARFRLGALYPPVDHPYWEAYAGRVAPRRDIAEAFVDGNTVLSTVDPVLETPDARALWDFPAPLLPYPALAGRVLSWRTCPGFH